MKWSYEGKWSLKGNGARFVVAVGYLGILLWVAAEQDERIFFTNL